jgi:hypothetical protein
MFRIQDINEYLHKIDILCKPFLIYCNPDDKQLLLDAIGDMAMIEEIPFVESGKVLVIDRAEYEKQYKEWFEGFVDVREIGNEFV